MSFVNIKHHMATAHKVVSESRKCEICDEDFVTVAQLNKHYIELHPKSKQTRRMQVCKSCFKSYNGEAQLRAHEKGCQTDRKTFSCDQCNFSTKYKKYLKTHIFKKHERTDDKRFECDVCGKFYTSEFWMHRHKMRVHEDERRYPCDKCHENFKSKQSLENHLLREHSKYGRLFKCELCASAFYTKRRLDTHTKRTHGEKIFQCYLCKHTTNYPYHLDEHIRFVHLKEKPFKCKHCPKTASSKQAIKEHEAVHEGKLQYQCESCPYKSAYKANLARHIRTHHDKVRYKCDKCGRKSTLRDHISKLHENPDHRPFSCEICKRGFKCKIACDNHAKIHKEKNIKCDKCNFKTVHKISMKEHMRRIHEDEGFQCDICGAKVATKQKIKRHMMEVHLGMKPFHTCGLCPFKARSLAAIKMHFRKKHADSEEL